MCAINFIKEFKLILGTQEIIAAPEEFQFLGLVDKGIRTLADIDMVISHDRLDTQGRPLMVLGEYSKLGYQALVHIEARHHIRKIGVTSEACVKIKGPSLLAVYDADGIEIKDQDIIEEIACYLEIRQSYSISMSDEYKRQCGRTTRFMNTIKSDDIVVAHDETFKSIYQNNLLDLGKSNEVKIVSLGEFAFMPSEVRRNLRVPHDYYEYHKVDVRDLL